MSDKSGTKHWALLVVIVLTSVVLDQATKLWALSRLSMPNPSPPALCATRPGRSVPSYQRYARGDIVVVSRDYLDFAYAENCGGAFSLLVSVNPAVRRVFFLGVGLGAVAFVIYLYRASRAASRWVRLGLPLVLGGAIGNLIDRIRLGYVVDFIHMHWRDRYHWPTYNVADIAITLGVACLILDWIFGSRRSSTAAAQPSR